MLVRAGRISKIWVSSKEVSGSKELYNLVAKRAEQRGKLKLEPRLHQAWKEATYEDPGVKYSPETIARVYFMNYAAGYVHPDEEAGVTLGRWLAKP